MTADLGIRLKNDGVIETHVQTTTSQHVTGGCPCGRDAWLIGGELWHAKTPHDDDGSRCALLELCPRSRPKR